MIVCMQVCGGGKVTRRVGIPPTCCLGDVAYLTHSRNRILPGGQLPGAYFPLGKVRLRL